MLKNHFFLKVKIEIEKLKIDGHWSFVRCRGSQINDNRIADEIRWPKKRRKKSVSWTNNKTVPEQNTFFFMN